jgi:glutamate receptor, ionotropic, invertebrate
VSESVPGRLFSFMNPLAVEIWLAMLGAYLLVSLTIWVVARFSPIEWRLPEPCCLGAHGADCQPEVFENAFTFANSFWFTIGTLMQQGSDLNPQVKKIKLASRCFKMLLNEAKKYFKLELDK